MPAVAIISATAMRSAFSIDVPSGFVVCAFADPMRREVHTKGDLPPEIEGIVQPVVKTCLTPVRHSLELSEAAKLGASFAAKREPQN